jgi:hypothetical protein
MTLPSDFDPTQESLKKIIELLTSLNDDQRRFVIVSAAAWFKDSSNLTPTLLKESEAKLNVPPTLGDFVFSKKTKNDAEAVAVLAYYLNVYRNQELFKTADLDALNKEAATGQIFGNITKSVNNATQRNRFFGMAGKGYKKITPLGKLVVEALPDEEKVKMLIKEHRPRPKRNTAKRDTT